MLALKYTLFAAISILTNLLVQYLSFHLYSGFASLYLAMLIGTLAGLVTKYILDKKWIFYHIPIDKKDDAKMFILYSIMGVFTTIIFWGAEIFFDYLFANPNAKYLGAIIGLGVGYVIKYYLDKNYVFICKEEPLT